ncbi:SEN34 subunit of tRNA-splicing endonuclease [Venturia nashicola]|uniref:tRNA-splicing endonuclease subunit Sen34 n=1 Tax=Venturia nashicola TaxID=86259 RepID=A0A4Z1PAK8_9PEZI|nr:SEN34 subunit of tRNA-splicing endonuclease [Venturia nashicola]
MASITVPEPFPISRVADRHLIFDINTATYIRREHHICGVFIGNIPQAGQQNIFNGIPLELMPEEARLLVERGHAYLVDDVASHLQALKLASKHERTAYKQGLAQEGKAAAMTQWQDMASRKAKALDKIARSSPGAASASPSVPLSPAPHGTSSQRVQPMLVTPTTSSTLIKSSQPSPTLSLPAVPTSYPLFTHLHSKGYFLSPGLRFGCQYVAYPGDPLRFHSHFLAVGAEWEEEIDLLDIVGGGRLGTSVKKGYLLGGAERQSDGGEQDCKVRTFCFEWAAM